MTKKAPTASSLRAQVEAQVEHLIGLLDQMDGDPDIERDEDFEPSIGRDELELDNCDMEPREPSFMFPNGAHLSGGGSGI